MRCRCCDRDVKTYFRRDGFYCDKCLKIIKDTLRDFKFLDMNPDTGVHIDPKPEEKKDAFKGGSSVSRSDGLGGD